jgi:hypothetical protein
MSNKKKFAPLAAVRSAPLKRTLDVILRLPSVVRIITGPSKGTRHSRPVGSIKLQEVVSNGVKMLGYGDRGITTFFVVTSNPETTRQEIEREFGLGNNAD